MRSSKRKKTPYIILILLVGFVIYRAVIGFLDSGHLVGLFDFQKEESFNYNDSALSLVVKNRLKDQEGEYAVVVKSLSDDSEDMFFLNEKEIFPAASLYKLFLMAAVMEALEKGELKEDQTISSPKKHLEEVLGGSEFGYEDFTEDEVVYLVSEALERVATISDNFAAVMLAEKLGWDKLQGQAKKMGANSTTIKAPISTTASDVALFFEKLYRKEVVSADASDKIIDLLAKSRINNRIPKYLPDDIKIAHKTAELSGVRHDTGIVFLEDTPYLIVLMSKDLKYEDDGVEVLAGISKDVFDYFSRGE